MLGGSSSMNLMLYVRGLDRDFNGWAAAGNKGWSYNEVLPFFKKSEANQFKPFVDYKDGKYHSDSGPLKVSLYGGISPFAKIFYEAGMERGIPFIDDINADKHFGFTNLQGTVFQSRRQSTAKAFLIPAMHRKNLHIIKNGFATKILIDSHNRAYGVKIDINGEIYRAYARKEVISSAGSIMSPVVLMHSGIGTKKQLKIHHIPCKENLRVGHNLWDHIYTMLFFEFDPIPSSPTVQLDNIFRFAIHNDGPLATAGISQLAGFINTTKPHSYPDIQLFYFFYQQNGPNLPAYIKTRQFKPEIADTLLKITRTRNIGAVLINLIQPQSSGQIRLNGSSPYNKPIIEPKYFSHREDVKTIIRALNDQVSYVNTHSYRKNGGRVIRFALKDCDEFEYMSDKYWECYNSYFGATFYHPVGTCKMGPKSDPTAVVDSELKVHNIKGLRVVDASM